MFHDHDLAFGIDHERAALGKAVGLDEHLEVAGERGGRVADHRELNLAHGGGAFMPGLVREVRVRGDGVDLNAEGLEFGVVFGEVFEFRRADEREVGRVEEDDGPMTLEGGFGQFDEFAVGVGLGLEGKDFSVQKGHFVNSGMRRVRRSLIC